MRRVVLPSPGWRTLFLLALAGRCNDREGRDPPSDDSGSGTAPVVDMGAYEFSAAQ